MVLSRLRVSAPALSSASPCCLQPCEGSKKKGRPHGPQRWERSLLLGPPPSVGLGAAGDPLVGRGWGWDGWEGVEMGVGWGWRWDGEAA